MVMATTQTQTKTTIPAHDSREESIRSRILFLLSVYPVMSPSMIQQGIGPAVPIKVWRPIYEALITEGVLKREVFVLETNKGQARAHTLVTLATPKRHPGLELQHP